MTNRKPWLEQLRRKCIIDPIVNDRRSVNGTRLGRDPGWIFSHAIGGGQADFDQPIEELSPRDRVMLYALFNQKAHIDELIHAFDQFFLQGVESFHDATVIDVGCGPFTAGLALANVLGSRAAYRYFGVDRASSMLTLANELAAEVRKVGEFNDRTEVSFHKSIDEISFGNPRAAEMTVFVLSYLLASNSVDVDALVGEINRARGRIGLGQTVVLYTNSAREGARNNYPKFRERMIEAGFKEHVRETERFQDTDKPRDIHYALFLRPAVTTFSMSEFLA
ncbi:hypothetical protein ACF8GG_17840 [Pseudomonas sp. yb_1]|uniref:hypothetical protein n=1 Tax=Pseudomonas sp. yb_1 TaxID=3367217 RepID=UPI00370C8565